MILTPRMKFTIIGAIAGAVLGATAAWAYYEQQEKGLWVNKRIQGKDVRVQAGAGDLVRVGLTMFGIVRSIQGMVKPV